MVAFSMGEGTLEVGRELFQKNRLRLCERLASLPTAVTDKTWVVLAGGTNQDRMHGFSSDAEALFRQESNFHWATGVTEPDWMAAINATTARCVLFMPRLPPEYAVWMGEIQGPDFFQGKYEVDRVAYVDEMAEQLASADRLLLLKGLNTDSGRVCAPATFKGMEEFAVDEEVLYPVLAELRAVKTPEEVAVIRYANRISSQAHKEVMRSVRPGMYEYQLESLFQHHVYARGGARHVCYTCIAASGPNAAVLHYGHAGAPNDRRLAEGDMCLFDMGAEYCCYCSDITCSFPASGRFSPRQRAIYSAVLASNRAVLAAAKPGVNWVDMHMLAERVLLQHLRQLGLVRGEVEEMMGVRLGALFMPHGLGHLMGVDVHDVSGYGPGLPPRPEGRGLRSLRMARDLLPGMVLTIEPGCYFIPSELDAASLDPALAPLLVPEQLKPFYDFGGVRIEDDCLITETGCELLTDVPRSIEDIEALMAQQPTIVLS